MSLHRLIFFKECGYLFLRSFISLRPFVSFILSVAKNLNHYRATFIVGFSSGFAFNIKHQGKVEWIKIICNHSILPFTAKYFSLTQCANMLFRLYCTCLSANSQTFSQSQTSLNTKNKIMLLFFYNIPVYF